MKQLQKLHEQFMKMADRPMSFGKLPISAREPDAPLVAMNRWEKCDDTSITKTYTFKRKEDRNPFLYALLEYEEEVGHNASITIVGDSVNVRLITHDIDQVTELDKEYASYADAAYKDIVTTPIS